jgi:hypothetical protein
MRNIFNVQQVTMVFHSMSHTRYYTKIIQVSFVFENDLRKIPFFQPAEEPQLNPVYPLQPTADRSVYCHRVDRMLGFSVVVGIGTPPLPHPQASVTSPPLVRLRERGWGVPIPARGQTLWYSRYIYELCDWLQCTVWKSASSLAI